jgi:hypothetical protein
LDSQLLKGRLKPREKDLSSHGQSSFNRIDPMARNIASFLSSWNMQYSWGKEEQKENIRVSVSIM